MLQTPSTFNPQVPFTSQMNAPGLNPGMMNQNMQGGGMQGGYGMPNAGMPNAGMPNSGMGGMPNQMDQIMGDPQTQSYAAGGRTRKRRNSMVEAYMSPDEIAAMVDAQGGPEYDRKSGRHVFKKLSRFLENPHVERAIKAKFGCGGRVNYAEGGHASYSMPERSPASHEAYARGGDTDLVYITPYMEKLFKGIGAHSENPVTGHPEYFGMSDIWNGIKEYGPKAVGLLNDYAPQIASAAMPFAASLPGWQGKLAAGALGLAPKGIEMLNNYLNPGRPQNAPSPNQMLLAQTLGQTAHSFLNPARNPNQGPAQFAGNVAAPRPPQMGPQMPNQMRAPQNRPAPLNKPMTPPMNMPNILQNTYGANPQMAANNGIPPAMLAASFGNPGMMNPGMAPGMNPAASQQPQGNLFDQAYGQNSFTSPDLFSGTRERDHSQDVMKYLSGMQNSGAGKKQWQAGYDKYANSQNWAPISDGFVSNWQ